jgi:hypothetical protein
LGYLGLPTYGELQNTPCGLASTDATGGSRSTLRSSKGKVDSTKKNVSEKEAKDLKDLCNTPRGRPRRLEMREQMQLQIGVIDNVNSGISEQLEFIELVALVAGVVDSQDGSELVM